MGPLVRLSSKTDRAYVLAAALAAAACAAVAAAIVLRLPNSPAAAGLSALAPAVAAFTAAGASAWAVRQTRGRVRVGWTLLAMSSAAWAAGQSMSSVYSVGLGIAAPFPGWSDVGFVSAMPLAIVGIRAFWDESAGAAVRWRVWLDGLIISLALTYTAWVLGLRQLWFDVEHPPVEHVLNVVYAFGAIIMVTTLILGIRRATRRRKARVLVLLAGVATIAFTDSALLYLAANGWYTSRGSPLAAGWVAGYTMIAFAAVWPRGPVNVRVDRIGVDMWQLAIPWLSVLSAGVSAFGLAITGRTLDPLLTGLTGVGAGLLTIEMVLTSRDILLVLIKSQASEATLAEIIAKAPAGVVRIDTSLRIIDATPRFADLFATGPQSLAGQAISSYFSETDASRFVAKLGLLEVHVEETVEADAQARRNDGTNVWVHWSSTAVRNEQGESEYFIAMFEDTTARHAAEAAAAANLELMQRLNSVKTEFLQSVSHEFKTALIGIQGFSEFMRDTDELDLNDARAFATDIHRDAERLDRMITEMVALDSLETTHANLRLGPVDMNELVGREVDAARSRSSANPIEVDLAARLSPVSGDEAKLADVLRHLLDNAARYSPAGGTITVTTRDGGASIEVAVRDQGLGDRGDFDRRLFGAQDLYADSPIRKIVGTGLGLGIVRQVVELHGGRIWVDRVEGVGSEFHFLLPAIAAKVA